MSGSVWCATDPLTTPPFGGSGAGDDVGVGSAVGAADAAGAVAAGGAGAVAAGGAGAAMRSATGGRGAGAGDDGVKYQPNVKAAEKNNRTAPVRIIARNLEDRCAVRSTIASAGWTAGSAAWGGLRSAWMPARVQRRSGSVCRHSRQIAKKGSGMVAGICGSPPCDLSQTGGCCVRASTRSTPRDQISAAGATLSGPASGGS